MASSSTEVEIKRLKEDDEEGSDRLSELPESILCSHILTRLPITDAVRSSFLSATWRYLWTQIPHLHFSPQFFDHLNSSILYHLPTTGILGYENRRKLLSQRIEIIVEHVLVQHQAPLENLQFHLNLPGLEAMDINRCIHYAAMKGVKGICLREDSRLSHYELMFPEIPTCSENLSFLKSCCLWGIANLTDQMLQRLLDLCPNLQKLEVTSCEELFHLKIQAPNLNFLILVGCTCVESLTVDCPQLIQLKISGRRSSSLEKLQLNSYNLIELKLKGCCKISTLQLNSCVFLKEVRSFEELSIEGSHSTVKSLRKLSLQGCILPNSLFGTFPDLEELKVSPYIMGIAVAQTVRGQEQESCEIQMEITSDFAFPNLKNTYLGISSSVSEEEVAVLSFLLKNAPSLNTLTLIIPYFPEDITKEEFRNQLLGLKRASAEVEIKILERDDEKDEQEYDEEDEGP